MKRFCLAAVTVLVPFAVMAQGAKVPEKDVVARLLVDFDQDGVNDLLVFTSDKDGGPFATLHVFKGEKDAASGKEQLRLLSKKAEFGYGVYELAEPRKGIITVESGNAQGRYKWDQKLTLAWRSGRLVVLGITYSSYDSIADDAAASECDLNLSTGKGTGKRNRAVTFSLKPVPVAEWTDEKRPKVCE
jgi:hypothetical protein